ncbi:unnamed protein product [Clavelina lepadiformis]|uniref:Collagen alpha-1(XII) chain n=1 Tax=Clavelina lepadiformis TaxID=159417 RepID=A0ABP0EXT9_CLALP
MMEHLLVAFLVFAGYHLATSQQQSGPHPQLPAPVGLSVGSIFSNGIGENWAIVEWFPEKLVDSYILRIYRKRDNILFKQIGNVRVNIHNVTGLDAGTEYEATVAAIYIVETSGLRLTTRETERETFRTLEMCKGGQVFLDCSSHCIHSCDDPDPLCDRRCVPGCGCPLEAVIWNRGRCIIPQLCPAPIGVVSEHPAVSNIRRLPTFGDQLVLTWDKVAMASGYTVKVLLDHDRKSVVQSVRVSAPIVGIESLTPGETYAFRIIPIFPSDAPAGRALNLPPTNVRISNVGRNSFRVSWDVTEKAARYSVILYDEDQRSVLYENDKIASNSIIIENLSPGSVYYVTVASANRQQNIGYESTPLEVRTLGEPVVPRSMIIAHIDLPTTPTTSTTTTTTTTEALTACRQKYRTVEKFYESFPDEVGPRFPRCDETGQYFTTECSEQDSSICWCIHPETGSKLLGSNFGGDNSLVPIDCDHYGELVTRPLNLRVRVQTSNLIELEWDSVPEAAAYIAFVEDGLGDPKTYLIENDLTTHVFSELTAGTMYLFGVYVIDDLGWSSIIHFTGGKTLVVDRPVGARVVENIGGMVVVQWRSEPSAEYYNVELQNAAGDILRSFSEVFDDSVTFTGLQVQENYQVQIRAGIKLPDPNDPAVLVEHESETTLIRFVAQCQLPPLDVIFVLDTSEKVGWDGLQKVKALMSDLSIAFPAIDDTSATGTRLAAVKYSRSPRVMFPYDRFKRTADAVGAIRYLRYNGGNTLKTGLALNYVTRHFFTAPAQDGYVKRLDALNVVIMFSGGKSTDDSISIEARRLKALTNVIAIGVKDRSDGGELNTIASSPELVFMADSYNGVPRLRDNIMSVMCSLSQP